MKLDLIDISLILLIAGIVGLYAFVRYREEKKKKERELIPTLRYYRKKFTKERSEYRLKAERFRQKMEEYRREIDRIKESVEEYHWKQDEKRVLKTLKGTDFEWTFSVMFEILGYKVSEPAVYKDSNIDLILEDGKTKICVDFVDRQQVKKLDGNYVELLLKGKEKYRCDRLWIITNSKIDEKTEKILSDKKVELFGYDRIVSTFPSIRIVEDYYETKTKFHNYELLHRETSDEVIRRDTWIKEVEQKLEQAYKKLEHKKMVAK
ncbi:MAG: hypothetical protein GXN94_05375 [Aquificae bacterium]|nr:hypothetical protein [Aquificota bacterium]